MNGLPNQRAQSTPGRSDPPVKPTSEVAHQPGQQPAKGEPHPYTLGKRDGRWQRYGCMYCDQPPGSEIHNPERWGTYSPGSAVECSTERSRAPDRQPVAPVEGRAWETPATRTV